MRKREHLLNYKFECFDKRDLIRAMDFFTVKEIKEKFGIDISNDKNNYLFNHNVKEWTEENVIAQLKKDVLFGYEKAYNRRGLSAPLMFMCIKMWLYILEDDFIDLFDEDYYVNYGLKSFKDVIKKYDWENEI